MLFEVLDDYKNDDPNPIKLLIGDTMQPKEVSNPNGPYPNWIFCTSTHSGDSGWVPMNILIIENGIATATKEYTSKEMTVTKGDIVDTIYELNGWYWCIRKSDDEMGWVAKDNLKIRI